MNELLKLIFVEPQILIKGHQLNRYFADLLFDQHQNLKYILPPTTYEKTIELIDTLTKNIFECYIDTIYIKDHSNNRAKVEMVFNDDKFKQIITNCDITIFRQCKVFRRRGLTVEQRYKLINNLLDGKNYDGENILWYLQINKLCDYEIKDLAQYRQLLND